MWKSGWQVADGTVMQMTAVCVSLQTCNYCMFSFLLIVTTCMDGAEIKSQSLPLCVLFTRLKGLMYAFAWSVHWYSDTGKHGGWKDASLSALKLTVISFLHWWADVELAHKYTFEITIPNVRQVWNIMMCSMLGSMR